MDRNHCPDDAEPPMEREEARLVERQREAAGHAAAADAEAEERALLAAPMSRVRALAYASHVVVMMEARRDPIGTRPTYLVELVRTYLAVARERLQLPRLTAAEHDVIDAATRTVHRAAVRRAKERGTPLIRLRRVGHRWLRPAVCLERPADEMSVIA